MHSLPIDPSDFVFFSSFSQLNTIFLSHLSMQEILFILQELVGNY